LRVSLSGARPFTDRPGIDLIAPHGEKRGEAQLDPAGPECMRKNRSFIVVQMIPMKIREIIRILEDDGWILIRTKGSHRQYRHTLKKGIVTIAGHRNDDLAQGTLNSIFRQAGLQ
jgi:predicted RNA binding protein YcfA (HicA-like mRNA interferase family)